MFSPSNFKSGSILFIKNYQFNNGSSSDKILIILCTNRDQTAIIYSLTTSKEKLPGKLINHGCLESNDVDISAYIFKSGNVVGTKLNKLRDDFSFDKNTILFLQESIVEIPISNFDKYISSKQLFLLGRLYSSELKSLIKCINDSSFVKRGIKSKILSFLSYEDLEY